MRVNLTKITILIRNGNPKLPKNRKLDRNRQIWIEWRISCGRYASWNGSISPRDVSRVVAAAAVSQYRVTGGSVLYQVSISDILF
jgi:hypothetical protein